MKIDNYNDLSILLKRILPEKFKGTTFENILQSYLKYISEHQTLVDNFTNKIDLNKIETIHGPDEINAFIYQYGNIIYDIINIKYPNFINNGDFINDVGNNFYWGTEYIGTPGSFKIQDRKFIYTSTGNNNDYILLYQDFIKKSYAKKFEIQVQIDDIKADGYTDFTINFIKNTPLFKVYKPGTYSIRIDLDELDESEIQTGIDANKFIIKSNTDFTISKIEVKEYDRINKDDIDILLKNLSQNKGNISSYKFLFKLLNNLGTDVVSDTYVITDEQEKSYQSQDVAIDISEISDYTNKNIKYGYNAEDGTYYYFNGQKVYDKGYMFESNTSDTDVTSIVPFIYKIDATFIKSVYDKYIKPIVHPVGWDLIYNIYSLNKLLDASSDKILFEGLCSTIEGTNTIQIDNVTLDSSVIGKKIFITDKDSTGIYNILNVNTQTNIITVDISYIYSNNYTVFFKALNSPFKIIDSNFYQKDFVLLHSDDSEALSDSVIQIQDAISDYFTLPLALDTFFSAIDNLTKDQTDSLNDNIDIQSDAITPGLITESNLDGIIDTVQTLLDSINSIINNNLDIETIGNIADIKNDIQQQGFTDNVLDLLDIYNLQSIWVFDDYINSIIDNITKYNDNFSTSENTMTGPKPQYYGTSMTYLGSNSGSVTSSDYVYGTELSDTSDVILNDFINIEEIPV